MGDTLRESVETEIGGVRYKTTRYNPEKALRMLTRLGALLGGPMGQAIGAFASGDDTSLGGMLDALDGDLFGRALRDLFTGIHAADAPTLLREILSNTDVAHEGPNGLSWDKIDINRDFRDSLSRIFVVAGWVLRFNFANFTSEFREFIPAEMLQKVASLGSK